MASHKEILKKQGIIVDDSHLKEVKKWRAVYECEGADRYEKIVSVDKETGASKAIDYPSTSSTDTRKKASYNAHIQACVKWAGLIFNEHTELQVSDVVKDNNATAELDFLKKHYEKAGVWPMLEESFPEMFGVGTIAVVTEYSKEFGIVHKWYSAANILPMEVCQGRIRSAVFISEFEQDGKKYTLYNVHREQRQRETKANGTDKALSLPGNSTYEVTNIVCSSEDDGGKVVDVKTLGIVDKYSSPVRLFSVFKPFNRKIKDFNNAFGIPIYYDHFDKISEIDSIYDFKGLDLDHSRRIIFTDKDIFNYGPNGRAIVPSWLNSIIVSTQALDAGRGGELKSNFITEFLPELRQEQASLELQAALNRFSDAVGLGSEAFKIERGQKATATQVVSEGQEKYTNLKKHLSIISSEFIAFNRAILSVARESEQRTELDPDKLVGFFVQDSVVVDDETRKSEALQEVRDGVRSKESYLEEFRGLSGEELEEELTRLKEAAQSDYAGWMDMLPSEGASASSGSEA